MWMCVRSEETGCVEKVIKKTYVCGYVCVFVRGRSQKELSEAQMGALAHSGSLCFILVLQP